MHGVGLVRDGWMFSECQEQGATVEFCSWSASEGIRRQTKQDETSILVRNLGNASIFSLYKPNSRPVAGNVGNPSTRNLSTTYQNGVWIYLMSPKPYDSPHTYITSETNVHMKLQREGSQ